MINNSQTFLELALSRTVVAAAIKVAILVGTVLAFINHGSDLMQMNITLEQVFKITITYLVPYCVSTYSSVRAIQSLSNKDKQQ